MNLSEFEQVFNEQVQQSGQVLVIKGKEYATADRLHNFKKAAALTSGTPAQALGGMMVKHIVSVFDMINTGKSYPKELWDEKIGDAINYLILLKAITVEEAKGELAHRHEAVGNTISGGLQA